MKLSNILRNEHVVAFNNLLVENGQKKVVPRWDNLKDTIYRIVLRIHENPSLLDSFDYSADESAEIIKIINGPVTTNQTFANKFYNQLLKANKVAMKMERQQFQNGGYQQVTEEAENAVDHMVEEEEIGKDIVDATDIDMSTLVVGNQWLEPADEENGLIAMIAGFVKFNDINGNLLKLDFQYHADGTFTAVDIEPLFLTDVEFDYSEDAANEIYDWLVNSGELDTSLFAGETPDDAPMEELTIEDISDIINDAAFDYADYKYRDGVIRLTKAKTDLLVEYVNDDYHWDNVLSLKGKLGRRKKAKTLFDEIGLLFDSNKTTYNQNYPQKVDQATPEQIIETLQNAVNLQEELNNTSYDESTAITTKKVNKDIILHSFNAPVSIKLNKDTWFTLACQSNTVLNSVDLIINNYELIYQVDPFIGTISGPTVPGATFFSGDQITKITNFVNNLGDNLIIPEVMEKPENDEVLEDNDNGENSVDEIEYNYDDNGTEETGYFPINEMPETISKLLKVIKITDKKFIKKLNEVKEFNPDYSAFTDSISDYIAVFIEQKTGIESVYHEDSYNWCEDIFSVDDIRETMIKFGLDPDADTDNDYDDNEDNEISYDNIFEHDFVTFTIGDIKYSGSVISKTVDNKSLEVDIQYENENPVINYSKIITNVPLENVMFHF